MLDPYNPHAERALLGGLLLDGDMVDEVAEKITPSAFGNSRHRVIFEAMCWLASQGSTIESAAVIQWLSDTKNMKAAGGVEYLGELQYSTLSTAHIHHHADNIRDLSIRRKLAKVGQTITGSAFFSGGLQAHDLLDQAEREVFKITDQSGGEISSELDEEFCKSLMEWLKARHLDRSEITGLPTGISEFDRMTTGLQPSDLVVIAGRPGLGKTSLAMTIAQKTALEAPAISTLVFSLEMTRQQLTLRIISNLTSLDFQQLRSGTFDKTQWDPINKAMARIEASQLKIIDNRMMSVERIRSIVRRTARAEQQAGRKLGLVVIDYLQLMGATAPSHRDQTRTLELGVICRSLKALAGDTNLPIVLLSQLNREIEKRAGQEVRLSDLRDSGAIEQDADMVVFVTPNEQSPLGAEHARKLVISKQRNGPVGECDVAFDGATLSFRNADEMPPTPFDPGDEPGARDYQDYVNLA